MGRYVERASALVVDPNPGVLASLTCQLRTNGFVEVRTFFTPREALASNALSPDVELLFTEVDFVDDSCLDLLRASRACRPDALRLIASATASRSLITTAMQCGAHMHLDKPLSPRAVAAAISSGGGLPRRNDANPVGSAAHLDANHRGQHPALEDFPDVDATQIEER